MNDAAEPAKVLDFSRADEPQAGAGKNPSKRKQQILMLYSFIWQKSSMLISKMRRAATTLVHF
jgi:hypothetical protein